MTSQDLKSIPGFIAWAEQGEGRGYLAALAEHIDCEVGDTGYINTMPHQANINLGIQDGVRRVVKILKDPLSRKAVPAAAPRPSYGVTDSDTDAAPPPDWK